MREATLQTTQGPAVDWSQAPEGAVAHSLSTTGHGARWIYGSGIHGNAPDFGLPPGTITIRPPAELVAEVAFYRRRCELLQQLQTGMQEPERTMVCDVLANGRLLEPAGSRYARPVETELAQLRAQVAQLETERHRLRAQLAGQWLPMETAPRDVSVLILTDHRPPYGQVHVARFTDSVHGGGIYGWAVDDCKFGPYALRGYSNLLGWQPLPPPPQSIPAQPETPAVEGSGALALTPDHIHMMALARMGSLAGGDTIMIDELVAAGLMVRLMESPHYSLTQRGQERLAEARASGSIRGGGR